MILTFEMHAANDSSAARSVSSHETMNQNWFSPDQTLLYELQHWTNEVWQVLDIVSNVSPPPADVEGEVGDVTGVGTGEVSGTVDHMGDVLAP